MSEENSTAESAPDSAANSPAQPEPNQGGQSVPATSTHTPGVSAAHPQNGNSADLLTAIQSMPERIVNAMREATQPQTPAATPATTKTETVTETATAPGKRKYPSFGHRWFGVEA